MAKELHITIDDVIGAWEEDGMIMIGYMDFMLEGALAANPDATDLVVHLDCVGGCTYQGGKIYNRLLDFRNTPGNTLRVINEAMAASMATVILQAATPGMRESRPLAPFMVHKPLFMEIYGANADDLEKYKAQLDMLEASFAKIYSEATGRTPEEIHGDMKEALFITAQVALERGYIDRILEESPSKKPVEREAKAVAFYNPPKENNSTLNIETPMAKTKEPTKWDQVVAFIKNLAGEEEATPQNEAPEETPVATTDTLEGGDTIYFEGTLAEGTAVFTDAEMTMALSDGEHTLSDGRVLTIAAGVVEAITEPAPANSAELEAANAKIAELESQLATATAQASAKDTTIKNLRAEVATARKVTPVQNFAGDTPIITTHPLDGAAKNLKKSK